MKKLFLITITVLFCMLAATAVSRADTVSDLQSKIDSQNKALSDLTAEIAGYEKQLTAIGADKNTLNNAIKTLTLESSKLKASITLSKTKIAAASDQIDSLSASIQKNTTRIGDLNTAIAKNIRDMNMYESESVDKFLVSTISLSTLWHYAGEENAFREGMQTQTKELTSAKEILQENKGKVESVKKDLLAVNAQLQDQKTLNQQTQTQKTALLQSTKNQEANYQKLLAQKKALKAQMESDLHDYESRLKYVLNPSLLPPSGSSPLAWPLDHFTITQLFGKSVSAARLYVSGSHNGVDFGVPVGTPVKAMATGVVVATGNSDISCPGASYGNWVFIKYNNGLASVYGHLSLIKAHQGDTVVPGDVVALSGKTGYATGPHLHVSIFPNDGVSVNSFPSKACPGRTITIPTAAINAYLDPMLYFPKQASVGFKL